MKNMASLKGRTILTISMVLAVLIGIVYIYFLSGYSTLQIIVTINANIYSTENNLGILNENCIYNLNIKNNVNRTQIINVKIYNENVIIQNNTYLINPKSSKEVTINQKLTYPGIWSLKIFNNNEIIDSYSFNVVINKVEAEVLINQWNSIKLNRNVSIFALIISIISISLNIIIFITQKQLIKRKHD